MNVLGISFGYHDSSIALVMDGELKEFLYEERFSNKKHDANFPILAIEYCLKKYGLKKSDIDRISFHEDPFHKFTRVLCSSTSGFPYTVFEFVESTKEWFKRKLWALSSIKNNFSSDSKIDYFAHHYSHAQTAFLNSNFDKSIILVFDAVGDWFSSASYIGEWKNSKPEIKTISEVSFPNSLGLVYSAVTAYLGFNPNDGECSTMALGCFGEPKYLEDFRAILGSDHLGNYSVDRSYFNFVKYFSSPVTKKFINKFGKPFGPFSKYKFDSLLEKQFQNASPEDQRMADIACSLQVAFEEIVISLASRLVQEYKIEKIAFAGGCALNCKLNSALQRALPNVSFFIPFDPGDGGTALGTALFISATDDTENFQSKRNTTLHPYHGNESDADTVIEMIPFLEKETLERIGVKRLTVKQFKSDQELSEYVAKKILLQRIVGWFEGRGEIGPRALGKRSILADPSNLETVRRLSRHVKERAAFRPYALSILKEDSIRIVDEDPRHIFSFQWMQHSVRIKPEYVKRLRGGLHVDHTSRIHICEQSTNSSFHGLLEQLKIQSGLGAVINTSFNPSGYPIVGSSSFAFSMFLTTQMDVIVLDQTVIEKEYIDEKFN